MYGQDKGSGGDKAGMREFGELLEAPGGDQAEGGGTQHAQALMTVRESK